MLGACATCILYNAANSKTTVFFFSFFLHCTWHYTASLYPRVHGCILVSKVKVRVGMWLEHCGVQRASPQTRTTQNGACMGICQYPLARSRVEMNWALRTNTLKHLFHSLHWICIEACFEVQFPVVHTEVDVTFIKYARHL